MTTLAITFVVDVDPRAVKPQGITQTRPDGTADLSQWATERVIAAFQYVEGCAGVRAVTVEDVS